MGLFKGKESEFLNDFYNSMENYMIETYHEINRTILHDNGFYNHTFSRNEITGLILLNKNFFQNLAGFFEMSNMKLSLPAFNALRASIECLRLFRLYFLDAEFRKNYLNNKNVSFDEVRDNEFTQGKIIKKLENLDVSNIYDKELSELIKIGNHYVTKGSAISRIHSELSKWSHSLNINLIALSHIERKEKKIYLGLDDDDTDIMQSYIAKYLESVYIIHSHHLTLFFGVNFSEEWKEKTKRIKVLYDEYTEKFY